MSTLYSTSTRSTFSISSEDRYSSSRDTEQELPTTTGAPQIEALLEELVEAVEGNDEVQVVEEKVDQVQLGPKVREGFMIIPLLNHCDIELEQCQSSKIPVFNAASNSILNLHEFNLQTRKITLDRRTTPADFPRVKEAIKLLQKTLQKHPEMLHNIPKDCCFVPGKGFCKLSAFQNSAENCAMPKGMCYIPGKGYYVEEKKNQSHVGTQSRQQIKSRGLCAFLKGVFRERKN